MEPGNQKEMHLCNVQLNVRFFPVRGHFQTCRYREVINFNIILNNTSYTVKCLLDQWLINSTIVL